MVMQTGTFQVLSHRIERLTMVCHCPDCGKIYHSGKYRIQKKDEILCYRGTMECAGCGKEGLPFPALFEKAEDVAAFYKKVKAGAMEMALTPTSSLETAFVDPEFFALNKKIH